MRLVLITENKVLENCFRMLTQGLLILLTLAYSLASLDIVKGDPR